MKFKSAVVMGVLSAVSLVAAAQWQWIDNDGRRVFSDRAPPAGTPQKNILKQPGGSPVPAPAAETAKPAAAAPAPRRSGKEKELEDKKKQAEQAEAQQKKADEEKYQKARADNCARARQSKAGLDSGVRVVRTNEQGEREVLDEAAYAEERKRVQELIQSECN